MDSPHNILFFSYKHIKVSTLTVTQYNVSQKLIHLNKSRLNWVFIIHMFSSFVYSEHSFIHHTSEVCNLLGAVEVGDRVLCAVGTISHKWNEVKSNLQ